VTSVDLEIDASGLPCPLPLLKAKQGLNQLTPGQCLKLTATDPGSVRDFHSFADLSAHELVEFRESEGSFIYLLRKA
jgi:tRNA 2-thiouridine synthesizing protein A